MSRFFNMIPGTDACCILLYGDIGEYDDNVRSGDIAQLLNMTQSAISHQLRILKQNRLVKNRRDGKSVFYSLADGHVKTIISQGMEHIQE